MTRSSSELLGYTVALFTCYGLFLSIGMGRATFSLIFLTLGIAAAMSVIVQDHGWAGVLTSVLGVALLCALGFAFSCGGYQVALWAGMPTWMVRAGVR